MLGGLIFHCYQPLALGQAREVNFNDNDYKQL